MKNVQIIDGALNCTYSVFAFTDDEFKVVFPGEGQDIEFIEDVAARLGEERLVEVMKPTWERILDKKNVNGIHGTLFYQLEYKKRYYPTKKDNEMVTGI